ncbi:hypothetical protein GGU11DRAFT_810678, partial [Lentinula aff. detonsa]
MPESSPASPTNVTPLNTTSTMIKINVEVIFPKLSPSVKVIFETPPIALTAIGALLSLPRKTFIRLRSMPTSYICI